jgi:hypothetical protein
MPDQNDPSYNSEQEHEEWNRFYMCMLWVRSISQIKKKRKIQAILRQTNQYITAVPSL